MSVLLTGGTGYIGSHAAVALTQAGHRVVLYDNLCNSSATVVDRLFAITGKRLAFVEGDVADTRLLLKVLREHQVTAVVHFAGLKAVNESIIAPVNYYSSNVQGTISLLKAMDAMEIRKLVFSSSATVYGHPDYTPIDEDHPKRTTNPYGRSKLHIEDMLYDVAQSHSDWRIACLRYFNPVGAHKSGLIGEDPIGLPNNLMPYIAQVAAGKLPRLSVFGSDYETPDGTGIRDYIHVMDLAEGHLAALDFLRESRGWHTFNLGTGKGHSVLEMARTFEAVSGRSVHYRLEPRRRGDVAVCYANPQKAARYLNWTATRTLEDMCASTWHWQASLLQDEMPLTRAPSNWEFRGNPVAG
ncbi:UDP-glucose 4-epimerase GalE [Neorhizobium sp. P12A]|nr:UDP-glucose 4-epimerase GalE [Neorhizobium sp. P12A]KAA0699589.1 UDP-glucose 4-epimerase GalE [Neorhizobium sp. P12A]